MLSEIISVFLQILVFAFVPFVVYFIRFRRWSGFYRYIGLYLSNRKANLWAFISSTVLFVPILILVLLNPDFKDIMHNQESMTGKFRAMGFGLESVILLILAATLKTALAEEILFRGFVAKRLIAVTNYKTGNLIHAILFGLIHTLIFLSISDNVLFLTVIFLFPAAGSYIMVYLNEKIANGSIIPGWIAHTTANLLSYLIIGFVI